jgi:acetoin utilization deacetylase AcuC-like enzyme
MKVVFHEDFKHVYTSDPAAASGRMETIVETIEPYVEFVPAEPAVREHIAAIHTDMQIQKVENQGLYKIASLAAGGALRAAQMGLFDPCFGLIRPPGHHASAASSWGFCYFNDMAVALETLRRQKKIESACVLDIDLHFGDGTENIIGHRNWVTVVNAEGHSRRRYLQAVKEDIKNVRADLGASQK